MRSQTGSDDLDTMVATLVAQLPTRLEDLSPTDFDKWHHTLHVAIAQRSLALADVHTLLDAAAARGARMMRRSSSV